MADETEPTLKVRIITEADAAPLREHADAAKGAAEATEKLVATTKASTEAAERDAAALEKDATAAHRASEEYQRLARERQVIDQAGPLSAEETARRAEAEARYEAGRARGPVRLDNLATPLPGAAPAKAVDDVDEQIRGLRENTLAAKHELDDLLNRPGERTRQEIETITELQGVLRANAAEARQFAGGASPLVAAQLFALSKTAEGAASIQSAFKPLDATAARVAALKTGATAAKNELADLLNLPGDRTRQEIERITTLQGQLREHAREARSLGGRVGATDAAVLFALAKQSEATATIQSAYRPKAGAGGSKDDAGMTGVEAAALGAGLRSAGASGGFFTQSIAKAVSSVGLLRIALFGLAGVTIGAVVAGLAGLIGYFVKGAAATKEFQDGVTHAKTATSDFKDEVDRATKPVTDFLGRLGGKALDYFAKEMAETRVAIARFNNEILNLPDNASAGRAAERAARDAVSLATNLDGVTAAAARMNRELDASNGKIAALFAARNRSLATKLDLDLSQVDVEEAAGRLGENDAERERNRLRAVTEEERIKNELRSLQGQKEQADPRASAAEREAAEARAKVEAQERELEDLRRRPMPEDKGGRDERNKQLAAVGDELQKARGRADELANVARQAKLTAETLGEEVINTTLRLQIAANEAAKARLAQEKAAQKEQIEQEIASLEASHKLRMAQIREEGSERRKDIAQTATAATSSAYQRSVKPRGGRDRKTNGKSTPAEKRANTLAKENARREDQQNRLKLQRETDAALLAEEEAFLRKKLALADRLGKVTGETEDAKRARYDEAEADLIDLRAKANQREAALTKPTAGKRTWAQGVRPGFIDGRSQRTRAGIYDPEGGDIIEEQGVAKFGRDAMGMAIPGSRLRPSMGPVPFISPRGADPQRDAVGQPVKDAGAQVAAAVKEATAATVDALTAVTAAVSGNNVAVVGAIKDLRQTVTDLSQRVDNLRGSN